jgi:hypothetical protein
MHVLVVPARSRSKKKWYVFLTGGVTIPRLFSFCGGVMSGVKYQLLSVDGVDVELTSDYSLMWVDYEGKLSTPVLYYKGRRVVKKWNLWMEADMAEDPKGGNANTN